MTARQRLGLAASAAGLVLLLIGGREAAGLRMQLTPANLLIGARSVARAPDGTLFVGSDLARVHVYGAQGRPLRGFLVPVERFTLRVAPPDRLVLAPLDGAPPLVVDFDGEPREAAPGDAAAGLPTPPDLRIVEGDVVRTTPGGERVLVRGFESQRQVLVYTLTVGLCLFVGGFLLIGGVLATGRRAPA